MKTVPYCDEFIEFINYSKTVYHAVDYSIKNLEGVGYVQLFENEVCVFPSVDASANGHLTFLGSLITGLDFQT
jgi:hypothetical protein